MPHLNTLIYLAILLIAGLLLGRLVKKFKLPNGPAVAKMTLMKAGEIVKPGMVNKI